MKIAIGADHGGFELKEALIDHLRQTGHEVLDLGTSSREAVDYPDYARAVAEAVASGRIERGIVVERDREFEVPAFLMDRSLLRQVFENLILNAHEAIGESGRVRITTEVFDAPSDTTVPYRPAGDCASDSWPRVEQFVVVRVADSGPGIEAGDIEKIFYPLFTTKKQGSGIGLAVVRKIVDGHRGLIDVQSVPGQGAEFSVRLPMAQPIGEVRGR